MTEHSIKLFISYCHRDESLRQQLDKHLAPLKRQGVIDAWHDRQIRAGDEWANQIDDNLNQSDIILLLVSPDFVASDYCSDIELKQAVKRHKEGKAIIVPVILEPCDWAWLPFAKFQAFPKDAKPITTWTNYNEAFMDVAQGIRKVAQELFTQRQKTLKQKQADKQKYQAQFEEILAWSRNGRISIADRDTLDELREELDLSEEEASQIEKMAAKPLIDKKENIEKYAKTLGQYIKHGADLGSVEVKGALERRRNALGLELEDVEPLAQQMMAQSAATMAQNNPQVEKVDIPEATITAKKEEPKSSIDVFRFDVISVSSKGQEIKRETKQAEYFVQDLGDGIGLEMVKIPAGSFRMGTDPQEVDRLNKKYSTDVFNCELPAHWVNVPEFYMGKYLVTQAQWQKIMGNNPAKFQNGGNYPVENVSWDNCQEFLAKLNIGLSKYKFRLPSEAEWEYACRAGTETPFAFGETVTSKLVNFDGNYTFADEQKGEYREKTTPVGSFYGNNFGLYDMHGNLWEWCEDSWHENYAGAPTDGNTWSDNNTTKILRGGSWDYDPSYCRSAFRYRNFAPARVNYFGFRAACFVSRSL